MIELQRGQAMGHQLDQVVSWLNNKELMKYSEQRHKKHSSTSQRLYYRYMEDNDNPIGLIICNGVFIGTVSATIDHFNSVANAGILISPEYTGKGHACEAWRIFCKELGETDYRKIEGGCMAQNKAMLRIFEKNGMRLEGTRRHHFMTGKGQYDDMVLYGKLT